MKNSLLYLIIFVSIQFVSSIIVTVVWKLFDEAAPLAPMMIVSSTVFSVAVLIVFLRARWAVLSPNYLRTRPWGVAIWCVLAAVGSVIPSIWLQEQMPELPDLTKENMAMILRNPLGYVVVGVFAPFIEEVVFRGAILRSLLGWTRNHWLAIAVSALLFAVVHMNPAQMPHAFVVGLLLGWMYYRTESIILGVVFHWVNNSIAYVMCNMMPDPDIPLVTFFNGSEKAVVIALVSSLCILIPSLYQLALRMKRAGIKD